MLAALALSVSTLTGCAADSDDEDGDGETAEAAATRNAGYDAAVRTGKPTIKSVTTPTAEASATTTLVGFVPRIATDKTGARLLSVQKWTEITNADGSKPFTRVKLRGDSGGGATRTIEASVTMDGGVDIDVKVTAKVGENGNVTIKLVNTSPYNHWLAGRVLDPGKLVIEVKLVKYEGGTIVDASMKAKLNSAEDRAADIVGAIAPIFDWLKRTAR